MYASELRHNILYKLTSSIFYFFLKFYSIEKSVIIVINHGKTIPAHLNFSWASRSKKNKWAKLVWAKLVSNMRPAAQNIRHILLDYTF